MADNDTAGILAALNKLDPANEAHWTEDGLPSVKATSEAFGESLTRKEITSAAPDFKRPDPDAGKADDVTKPNDGDSEPTAPNPFADFPDSDLDAPAAVDPEFIEAAMRADMAEIRGDKALLMKRLADVNVGLHRLTTYRAEIVAELDSIVEEEAKAPKESHAVAVQAYFAAQDKARAEQAHVRAALAANPGLALNPIDSAMARKTGFGHNRPNFPAADGGNGKG